MPPLGGKGWIGKCFPWRKDTRTAPEGLDAVEHGLASPQVSDIANSGLFVDVDDVDAHYEHARSAGARIDGPPIDQPYGRREYGARDLEGHRWWFGKPIAGSDNG